MWSAEDPTPTKPAMDEMRSNLADILEYRLTLKDRISSLLRQFDSQASVSDIEQMIFEEEDSRRPSEYLVDMLALVNAPESEIDLVIPVIQDAWNYLPHRSRGGRCPAELFNELARTDTGRPRRRRSK